MPSTLYTAEAVWLGLMVFLLWPLYVSQLLVVRFTPRRRQVRIKLHMLAAGMFGVLALSARVADPSAVFGRIPEHVNLVAAVQATTAAFFIAASWLLASARSLHAQIQQPMARWVGPSLYGSVFLFQLVHTSLYLAQSQMLAHPDRHSDWSVMLLFIPLDLALDLEAAFVLVCNWYLYLNLRSKTAAFLGTLTRQQAQVQSMVQRQQAQTASTAALKAKLAEQQAQQPLVAQTHPASDEPQALRVSTPVTPSLMSKASLSTAGRVPSALMLVPPPRVPSLTTAASSSAISTAGGGGAGNGVALIRAAMLSAPGSPPAAGAPRASPSSPPAMASVVAITIAAAAAASASGSKNNLTISSTASGSSSNSSSSSSAAQERVRELAGALRKMTYMALLVTVVCLGAMGNTLPRLLSVFRGEVIRRDLHGADPQAWTAFRMLPVLLHVLSFFVTVWYVWLGTSVWSSARVRQQRGTPFWQTLLYGVQDPVARYEAATGAVVPRAGATASRALAEPSATGGGASVMRTKSLRIAVAPPIPSATPSPVPATGAHTLAAPSSSSHPRSDIKQAW